MKNPLRGRHQFRIMSAMSMSGRYVSAWFAERRPLPTQTAAYSRWVRAVREVASIYHAGLPEFDMPAFYRACGMPSLRHVSTKHLFERID